jgi:hypothetical protein
MKFVNPFSSKPVSNIDLQEFVSQTMISIIDGVKDAQRHAAENGAVVYPARPIGGGSGELPAGFTIMRIAGDEKTDRLVSFVEFDVSVGVTNTSTGKAGIGVAQIDMGIHSSLSHETNNFSHIKFTIPVSFPVQYFLNGNK